MDLLKRSSPCFSRVFCPGDGFSKTEKSSLWTNTGVDQNFQRDLRAIGPYEFQEKSVWTNALVPFQRNSAWTNGPESSSRASPETGIGPRMASGSTVCNEITSNLLPNNLSRDL